MPKPRLTLNGFDVGEVAIISGLSRPMIDHLKRHDFLQPAYAEQENPRGRVRYYSYRNLLVARLIQILRETGIQLGRLKATAMQVSDDRFWSNGDEPTNGMNWVVSDGQVTRLRNQDELMEQIFGRGHPFAFVVNIRELQDDIRERISSDKRRHFSMGNVPLQFVTERAHA